MKILIIGSGGREHALAWKCAQSNQVTHVFVAPGNAGTQNEPKVSNIAIAVLAIDKLMAFAASENIALTLVGPETPLALGIVDQFKQAGLPIFGPTQQAAKLEYSKAFSKEFMQRYGIASAASQTFTQLEAAKQYVQQHALPLVIKADGLAAGKGVVIAQTREAAFDALNDMLGEKKFGQAGMTVVIEEFLQGEEASFIVMVDGEHIIPLATSQDHKARDNGDLGPNTGGMGAYSPAPIVDEKLFHQVMETIIKPTVAGLKQEGSPYSGFLYAGLMINQNGEAKVLEYNCRLGDPETQPILMRLQSDLVQLCLKALDQQLDQVQIRWDPRVALGVVLCAGGYPHQYHKGDIISNLPEVQSNTQKIFHAGTALLDYHLVTDGGRVLCVTALGDNVLQAQQHVYQLVEQIKWKNMYYRTDIGHKAINCE